MLSILITHYNRPKALAQCIGALKGIGFDFAYELVVSDDGSVPEVLDIIKTLSIDTLVTTDANQGLASNINKGIKACKGDYILYVQEDFIIDANFLKVYKEGLKLLTSKTLDMVRYRANYRFKKLLPCSEHVYEIPKFSFKNFHINSFRYSDHPFLTTPQFYKTYGYYLEGTSVGYGETEFAIRIMSSRAKIGITKDNYFHNLAVESTLGNFSSKKKTSFEIKIKRLVRALRQHLEWILYNPKQRKLYTYTNHRLGTVDSKRKL